MQLSGGETWEYCRQIGRPVIKVIHVREEGLPMSIIAELKEGRVSDLKHGAVFMLDTQSGEAFGGTGRAFRLETDQGSGGGFPRHCRRGSDPGQYRHMIREVRPWGVDVSSGVETNGEKDAQKIKTFIQAARSAQHEVQG